MLLIVRSEPADKILSDSLKLSEEHFDAFLQV